MAYLPVIPPLTSIAKPNRNIQPAIASIGHYAFDCELGFASMSQAYLNGLRRYMNPTYTRYPEIRL